MLKDLLSFPLEYICITKDANW